MILNVLYFPFFSIGILKWCHTKMEIPGAGRPLLATPLFKLLPKNIKLNEITSTLGTLSTLCCVIFAPLLQNMITLFCLFIDFSVPKVYKLSYCSISAIVFKLSANQSTVSKPRVALLS